MSQGIRFTTTPDSLTPVEPGHNTELDSSCVQVVSAGAYDALLRELAALKAAPAGFVMIPVKPPKALLISMAIRDDHALAVPGYYDQKLLGGSGDGVSHAKHFEGAICKMSQIYEEVAGEGFYSAEKSQFYLDISSKSALKD